MYGAKALPLEALALLLRKQTLDDDGGFSLRPEAACVMSRCCVKLALADSTPQPTEQHLAHHIIFSQPVL